MIDKIINDNMRFDAKSYEDLFDEKEIMRILDEENQIEDEKDKTIESLKMENQELKKRLENIGMTNPRIRERNNQFLNDLFEDK